MKIFMSLIITCVILFACGTHGPGIRSTTDTTMNSLQSNPDSIKIKNGSTLPGRQ